MTCLFCNFVETKQCDLLYEDDQVLAFKDKFPAAPTHILIIPKKHIATLNDLTEDDAKLIGSLPIVASKLAKKFNIAEDGYRLVFNCNKMAGQTVFHIHLHLLAGRKLTWPPG